MKKVVLTIAGSDSSGGAGIQADIKTITMQGHFATSVITAVVAQNTTGVFGIVELDKDFVCAQIDAVFRDIPPDAVKIGMVSNIGILETIVERLMHHRAKNIVVDPVMLSRSGDQLISDEAKEKIASELFPLARLVMPNIPEAEALCGFTIINEDDMTDAARAISRIFSCNILIAGGRLTGNPVDLLMENGEIHWLPHKRINNLNTHGIGCTMSSGVACGLAEGKSLYDSVISAKEYVTGALADGLNIGKGPGPLNHMYTLPR